MAQFFFANALDNDHGRLARHLVILDRICRGELLPRTLAPTVPSLCTRSTLLRGPLEARLVLEALSRFIRVDDDGREGGKGGTVGFADVLLGSPAATGDKAVDRAGDGGAGGERAKGSHKKIVLGKLLPPSSISRPHAACSTARLIMRSEGRQLPNKGEK